MKLSFVVLFLIVFSVSLHGQSGSINNTLGSGGTFKVKGATSDSLLVVKDNGNVGIGTSSPTEKLEVNGALKIGTTTQNNQGTVRFKNGKFEGYSSTKWYALNNEIYTMGPEIPFTSGVRGTAIDFANTSLTIPDTGWYLVVINASGYNNNSYSLSSGNYDETGYIYLRYATDSPGLYVVLHDFFSRISDNNSTVTTFKYVSFPVSHSFVRKFNAGDQLILGAIVSATGSPTGNWGGFTFAGADVIRIK